MVVEVYLFTVFLRKDVHALLVLQTSVRLSSLSFSLYAVSDS